MASGYYTQPGVGSESAEKDARFEDYLVFVAAIQLNITLKSLRLHPSHAVDLYVDEDESKVSIPVLKKKYGLEAIPGLHHTAGDIRSISQRKVLTR